MIGRRQILKLFGMAPAALPVAAREIAKSNSIGSFTSNPGILGGSLTASTPSNDDYLSHILKEIGKWAADGETLARKEVRFENIYRLDPDIASMRSLSLSAAMRIQRDRLVKRYLEGQRSYLSTELERTQKKYASTPK